MSRKDFYHEHVKEALEKDGWRVTHDPLRYKLGNVLHAIDLGAERILAAEKKGRKIAIEVKNFLGPSDTNEFHKMVGQFVDYTIILDHYDKDRILYIAIPEETYFGYFQEEIAQIALKKIQARLLIFDPESKLIKKWMNQIKTTKTFVVNNFSKRENIQIRKHPPSGEIVLIWLCFQRRLHMHA